MAIHQCPVIQISCDTSFRQSPDPDSVSSFHSNCFAVQCFVIQFNSIQYIQPIIKNNLQSHWYWCNIITW